MHGLAGLTRFDNSEYAVPPTVVRNIASFGPRR